MPPDPGGYVRWPRSTRPTRSLSRDPSDPSAQTSAFLRDMIGRGHVYQPTDEKGLDA